MSANPLSDGAARRSDPEAVPGGGGTVSPASRTRRPRVAGRGQGGGTRSRRKSAPASGSSKGALGGIGAVIAVVLLLLFKFVFKFGAVGAAVAYGAFAGGSSSYHSTDTVQAGMSLNLEVTLERASEIKVATSAKGGETVYVFWLNEADVQRIERGQELPEERLRSQMFYVGATGSNTLRLPRGKHYICFEPETDHEMEIEIDVEIL